MQCVAVCCNVLQTVFTLDVYVVVTHLFCMMLQCVVVRCSVLQCVAVCCSVLPIVITVDEYFIHTQLQTLLFTYIILFIYTINLF